MVTQSTKARSVEFYHTMKMLYPVRPHQPFHGQMSHSLFLGLLNLMIVAFNALSSIWRFQLKSTQHGLDVRLAGCSPSDLARQSIGYYNCNVIPWLIQQIGGDHRMSTHSKMPFYVALSIHTWSDSGEILC
jgi:hypothetical protein